MTEPADLDAWAAHLAAELGVDPAVLDVAAILDLASVAAHTDWPIPETTGALGQGKIAGVPAKIVVGDPTLLVTQVAYVDDLERRLGWR